MTQIGELAALATALCWAASTLAFDAAGRQIGSLSVNLIRLVIGFALLSLGALVLRGQAFPSDASGHAWGWLLASGVVGFLIGDLCLFRAFFLIGPRLSSLLMSTSPVLTALTGWLVLGERLSAIDLGAIVLVMTGIALAVQSRPRGAADSTAPSPRGILLGLGGAAGQAVGLVLSKLGMGDYDALAATQIRVIGGMVGFAVLFVFIGWWPRVIAALGHTRAVTWTAVGAVFGPFLGVTLSLLAVQHTSTGIAASLMATTPLVIIPLVVLLGRERVTFMSVVGSVVAVGGVMVLLLL